jgi:hypothetical protein
MPKAIQDEFDRVYAKFHETDEYKKFRKDALLLRKASKAGIAIGGSTGLHLALNCAHKVPGDFDFITDNHAKAWDFLRDYYTGMDGYIHHGRMYIQNRTDWCPDVALAHYHVESTIHTPFCIMVLPEGTLNAWYNHIGIFIQWSGDIVKAANELTERDGKPRVKPITDLLDDDFDWSDDFDLLDDDPTPSRSIGGSKSKYKGME